MFSISIWSYAPYKRVIATCPNKATAKVLRRADMFDELQYEEKTGDGR